MSEHAPAYYPPGWNRERMLNSGANDDREGLTEENMIAFRAGLKADVGERAYGEFFKEMYRREVAAGESIDAAPKPAQLALKAREPPFMEVMRLREQRASSKPPWNPWGFVVFKSPEIRDAAQWVSCKAKFEQIVRDAAQPYQGHPGLEACLSRLQFQWIEDVDPSEASMQMISQRAKEENLIKTETALWSQHPTPGRHHSLVLYITPKSLHSILNSESPAAAERQYRNEIPFAVAIATAASAVGEHDNEEPEGEAEDEEEFIWRGYFNVAVETLLTSLFPAIADDMLEPFELGGHVTGDDIWCDTTRWGIHKAGVAHRDVATQEASQDL